MAIRLYDISQADRKEVDRIRNALRSANIDYYETSSTGIGSYSPSADAIWVKTDSDFKKGRKIIYNIQKLHYKNNYNLINEIKQTFLFIIISIILIILLAWLSS